MLLLLLFLIFVTMIASHLSDEDHAALELRVVELLDRLGGLFGVGKLDDAAATGTPSLVSHDVSPDDVTAEPAHVVLQVLLSRAQGGGGRVQDKRTKTRV